MLGKGLESLIPQKGNGSGDEVSGRQPAPPAQPAGSQQPATEPTAGPGMPQRPEPPHAAPAVFSAPAREREAESVFHIETDRIKPNPSQPRRNFDEAALRELANSIREFGFLQPLVVSKTEMETPTGVAVEYQLIAGERRLLAAKLLGLASVPAIVRNVDLAREKLELAVIENIQREDLNPIETARAFARLQDEFRMTQREIAAKLGKSREAVANAVRLLDLPDHIRSAVEKGTLSESHARLLLAVADPAAQQHLFEDIVQNRLTTRDVKERVAREAAASGVPDGHRRGRPPKSAEAPLPPELAALQQALSADLGAPVEIHQGAAKGSIMITFYSKEELENIMRRLGKE